MRTIHPQETCSSLGEWWIYLREARLAATLNIMTYAVKDCIREERELLAHKKAMSHG
jgi:hypothetical protein